MALVKVSRSPRYVPEIEKDWPSRWTPKPSLPSTTDALRAKFWMCVKAAVGAAAELYMPGRV